MSVFISALKVKEFLGKELHEPILEQMEHTTYIYSLDLGSIKYLTKFEKGYYDTEAIDKAAPLQLSYERYNQFRYALSEMALNAPPTLIWILNKLMIGKPFVELINFADNEGSFDYVIAEKLYRDFVEYKDRAVKKMPEFYECYCAYMKILEAAIECKGIVQYS